MPRGFASGRRAGRGGLMRSMAGAVGILAAVAAVVSLADAPVTGQTRVAPGATAAPRDWTPPRTAWGDPDLQGFFTNNDESGIPLERPGGVEGRGAAGGAGGAPGGG